MQAKQTVVGFTRKFFITLPLLILVYLLAVLSFSLLGHAPSVFADCATGVQGVSGNTDRPDPTKCYDPTTNQVIGDATGAPADPNATPADSNNTEEDGNAPASETCAVEKIGWFVCPVMEQAARISDKAFAFLADNFLKTDPQLVGNQSGTKTAWEIARNLANVMFIIAFLAIIASQVTGMGINNYGIKKMLPRLIVAAIAVNVSYYICQLAVDLTNILGYEIQNALAGIANSLGPSVFGQAAQFGGADHETGTGNALTVITVAVLAAAGIVWLIMGPLMAVVMMVIITVITIIVILLLRKALIVLLIVVSPIAFVLYLLPNTEKLFSKWLRMFTQLLLIFPVVGLLFGAGQLASTIILVSGAAKSDAQVEQSRNCNPDNTEAKQSYAENTDPNSKPGDYDGCGYGYVTFSSTKDGSKDCGSNCNVTASWVLGLVAMGVAVAPLIAVFAVLKGALSAAGSIGGKIQAGIAKGGGNFAKRAEAADQARQNRMGLRAMQGQRTIGGGMYRRRAKRDAIRSSVEREFKNAQSSYIAGELTDADGLPADASLKKKMAGGYGLRNADPGALQRVEAAAISTARAEQSEAFKAASQLAADQNNAELHAVLNTDKLDVNDPTVAAAIHELGNRQDFAQLEKVMNKLRGTGPSLASRTLSSTLSENAGQMFTGGQLAELSRGQDIGSYMETVNNNLAGGVLSPEKMATLNPSLAAEVSHVLATSSASTDAKTAATAQAAIAKVRESSVAVRGDSILNKKISRIDTQLTNFAGGAHQVNANRNR